MEFKFKGYDKRTDTWFDVAAFDDVVVVEDTIGIPHFRDHCDIFPYIGIKDRFGKDVFECHKVRVSIYDNPDNRCEFKEYLSDISFIDGSFCYSINDKWFSFKNETDSIIDFEIIGFRDCPTNG